MMERKRKWKRWVVLVNIEEFAELARNCGMTCICAFTVSMCVHIQFGFYGTSSQMRATEEQWKEKAADFTNKQPSYAFSIDVDIPREKWVDKKEAVA